MYDVPVPLVHIEVCFDLVQHSALHLEESSGGSPSIRSHNVNDEPFLVLPLTDADMPVLDLFLCTSLIRLVVLSNRDVVLIMPILDTLVQHTSQRTM
jgi:hypothetical protein